MSTTTTVDARRAPGAPPDVQRPQIVDDGAAEFRQAYRIGYFDGRRDSTWSDGYAAGCADTEARLAALQKAASEISQMIAKQPPFAAVCEARGEHDRAAAQREILRQRGISLEGVTP